MGTMIMAVLKNPWLVDKKVGCITNKQQKVNDGKWHRLFIQKGHL